MKHSLPPAILATLLAVIPAITSADPSGWQDVTKDASQTASGQTATSTTTSTTTTTAVVKDGDKKPAAGQTTTTTPTAKAAMAKAAAMQRAAARAAGVPPKPAKPAWQEFKLDPKATMLLDFTDSNPDMILQIFARTSGITIVKDPSFKTTISVSSAKAVGLDDAFEILNTVLELNGYEFQKKGKLLVVGKKAAPAPVVQMQPNPQPAQAAPPDDTPVIRYYPVKFASASQLARVINEVFVPAQLDTIMQQLQGGGGQPMPPQFRGGQQQGPKPPKVIRASSDDYSNTVVVSAPVKLQDDVATLVKELDKSTEQPLESKIFRLKYISVEEAVDAIQNVLTANTPTGRGGAKEQNNQNQGYYYYRYAGADKPGSGAQSATGIKQTNSVIVSATKENIAVITQLVSDMDKESAYVGTTTVIHLENAKSDDVATLLNQAFTKRKDNSQNDNPFYYIYDESPPSSKKPEFSTDVTDAGEVVNVRDLTGKVNVISDPNTNSLIVVTLPSNLKLIKGIVDRLDRIADQVMIETVIVEANLNKETKLGVEWSFMQGNVFNDAANKATGTTDFGLQSTTPPPQGLRYTLSGTGYSAFVNALQTDTKFKVLSTPRIFTSNNVKAEIDVSEQLPYITTTQTGIIGNQTSSYDFKNIGITLTVTPRITSAGSVAMDVVQAADDLQGFTTFNAPIINHRQASTTVSVKDGETIILGGIIRHTINLTNNKVPLLGDLPLLGQFFRSTDKSDGQTELLVLLTPHIVRTAAEAQRLRAEETKRISQTSQDDLKKIVPPRKD